MRKGVSRTYNIWYCLRISFLLGCAIKERKRKRARVGGGDIMY